jgi:hypothetical protein
LFDLATLQSHVAAQVAPDDIWIRFGVVSVLNTPVQLVNTAIASPLHVLNIKPNALWAGIYRLVGSGVVKMLVRINSALLPSMRAGRLAIICPAYAVLYLKIVVSHQPELVVQSPLPPQPAEQFPLPPAATVISNNVLSSPPRSGLRTSHVYTVDALSSGLQLRWALKSSTIGFLDISKHVWKLTLERELANRVVAESEHLALPSRSVLDRAEIKLDVLTCKYWADQMDGHDCFSYLMIDSSPQGGWDLFACLDDVLYWPKSFDARAQADMNLCAQWSRRMLPISCLGKGCSSTFHRAFSLLVKLRVVSGIHYFSIDILHS